MNTNDTSVNDLKPFDVVNFNEKEWILNSIRTNENPAADKFYFENLSGNGEEWTIYRDALNQIHNDNKFTINFSSNNLESHNHFLTNQEIKYLLPKERHGDNFHIKVSKEEAEYLILNNIVPDIMNKEYGFDNDENWTGMNFDDLNEETMTFDDDYQTFEIDVNPISKTNLIALLDEINKISLMHQYDNNNQNINPLNYTKMSTQEQNTTEKSQFEITTDHLKKSMKYLGFGESSELHQQLDSGLKGSDQEFKILSSSDKALPGNSVDFVLNFKKSEDGTKAYFNSYNATLKNDAGEISHNFGTGKDNSFTAKQAVNLLEGRSVKIEFPSKEDPEIKESAFVKLNFDEKTEYGNYKMNYFNKNYGVDTKNIVDKSGLVFDKPEYRENTIKSLEKGNVVKVKVELNNKIVEANAVLNPQYKNLSLYDSNMNRINTNKPIKELDNEPGNDKNNVREQSTKRSL